jgi:hypothetical protein
MEGRWILCAGLLVWAAPLSSQAPGGLAPGTPVRITWRDDRTRMVGVLREVRGDTLVVFDSATGGEAAPRLEWLRSVEVSNGRRSGWAGTLTGATVAGAAGALITAAVIHPMEKCVGFCMTSPGQYVCCATEPDQGRRGLGIGLGGVLGALVG